MMESGNLPNRGKYGDNVSRALRFVLNSCQESGLIVSDDSQSPMYGHGFATLFLGEIYGMTGDDSVKEKLQKAISLIERSQSTQSGNEGGWRYQPVPYDADISVTICQVMALRAARDAGIYVEPSVMDRAIKYVQECQNPDGGFSYMARMGGGTGSGFGRSAAGVASLYYAGHFQGNDLDRGLKYLKQYTPRPGRPQRRTLTMMDMEGQYFYGNYYSVQAMFLAGGDYWADWYPGIREQLIARQSTSGNWSGRSYRRLLHQHGPNHFCRCRIDICQCSMAKARGIKIRNQNFKFHDHLSAIAPLVVVVLPILISQAAHANDWSVTTADFQTQPIMLKGLSSAGIAVTSIDGRNVRTILFDSFISIQRSNIATARTPKFTLLLAGGDRLVGEPGAVVNEQLTWISPALGKSGGAV